MANVVLTINPETYQDKVKACWIGKNIGGTMGGPFEGRQEVLDVKGFVTEKGEPLPNDDLDLQLAWLHALETIGPRNINASELGEFWLSFIHPHWNEYGVCKANMRRGLIPPLAGDYDNSWRDSNGAWIRTEIWACVAPGLPAVAAKMAIEDAKVDHGAGEGTVAAAFVAAMQSAAFVLKTLDECIDVALSSIPSKSRVAKSINLVLDYYKSCKSWVEARNAVLEQNADIGNGWFEAPSNVAYAIIGLVYGEGDFKKSMLTAINCGDDTDCTAATVGATMGILYGNEGIPTDWSEYIGDKIITISIAGGCIGRGFPKSCTELSQRVVAVAPEVFQMNNKTPWHWSYGQKLWVSLGKEEIPENILDIYKSNAKIQTNKMLSELKPYSMHFEEHYFIADVSLSTPEIAPGGEVDVNIVFTYNRAYEDQPYSASLRWILPEDFTAEGKQSLYIPRTDRSTTLSQTLKFKIRAGDSVNAENRVILEVLAHGRHMAMYISFPLLG